MRILVVGAGNLGLACAAKMVAQGDEVVLYTSSPQKWSELVMVEDMNGIQCGGRLSRITSDPSCARSVDIVFLCLPGHVLFSKLSALKPYLNPGTPVCSVFCGDGFFFVAEKVLGTAWPVLGFQRVPYICRTKIPYRVGGILGGRDRLALAQRNIQNPESWRSYFENLFSTQTSLLENYYDAALINGNVVMHPARIMSLKRQLETDGPFARMPLFYEEWDDYASELAIKIDDEVCQVADRKGARLIPFMEYYGVSDAASLTRKIRSIPAFKGIGSPVDDKGLLDENSRYIQADIFIALKNVVKLGEEEGVQTEVSTMILGTFSNSY